MLLFFWFLSTAAGANYYVILFPFFNSCAFFSLIVYICTTFCLAACICKAPSDGGKKKTRKSIECQLHNIVEDSNLSIDNVYIRLSSAVPRRRRRSTILFHSVPVSKENVGEKEKGEPRMWGFFFSLSHDKLELSRRRRTGGIYTHTEPKGTAWLPKGFSSTEPWRPNV